MKALIVVPNFGLGGTCTSLENLLDVLSSCLPDLEITLFSVVNDGEFKERFKKNKILTSPLLMDLWFRPIKNIRIKNFLPLLLVRGIKKVSRWMKLGIETTLMGFYAKQLDSNNYDFVIGYQEGEASQFAARITSRKHISWVHCDLSYTKCYDFNQLKFAYDKSDTIVCVSHATSSAFNKIFNSFNEKIKVIPNVINSDKILKLSSLNPTVADNYFGTNNTNIVSVGRLDPIKQFHLIPQIANELKMYGLDFRWLIIGSGYKNYEDKIKSEIAKFNVANEVRLIGFVANPYPLISRSDLFVCTSESEASPMVFLEANCLNKYIISNDFPSAHEFLDENQGTICTIPTMAQTILNALHKNQSRINSMVKAKINSYKNEIVNLISLSSDV